jgi:hypothetical protein
MSSAVKRGRPLDGFFFGRKQKLRTAKLPATRRELPATG